jgi:hypothetical protein
VLHKSKIFIVKLTPIQIETIILLRNCLVIHLGDNCYQEVQKNNKIQENITQPKNPNDSLNQVEFVLRKVFISPVWISW